MKRRGNEWLTVMRRRCRVSARYWCVERGASYVGGVRVTSSGGRVVVSQWYEGAWRLGTSVDLRSVARRSQSAAARVVVVLSSWGPCDSYARERHHLTMRSYFHKMHKVFEPIQKKARRF